MVDRCLPGKEGRGVSQGKGTCLQRVTSSEVAVCENILPVIMWGVVGDKVVRQFAFICVFLT